MSLVPDYSYSSGSEDEMTTTTHNGNQKYVCD